MVCRYNIATTPEKKKKQIDMYIVHSNIVHSNIVHSYYFLLKVVH